MIVRELIKDVPFNRVITPRWAHNPTSGNGAAKRGGRLNRPDVTALYLSFDAATALKEFQQDDPLLTPGVVATFIVNLARVVDFSGGYDPSIWDPLWMEISCNWRDLAFIARTEPPSWVLSDAVLESGAQGILFPSTRAPGGTNLVIYYPETLGLEHLRVHDPNGELAAIRPR